jgi:hypothetical protein
LAAPSPNEFAFATSINSAGSYIGNVRSGTPLTASSFLFDGAVLLPIAGVPGFTSSHVHRINDAGTIIGWGFNGDPVNFAATFIDCRAFVWRNGATSTLNSVIHSPIAGWDIRQVWDINNRGQIAGLACVNGAGPNCTGGVWRAVLLNPCNANCDGSTTAPVLNINDFVCFQQRFAAGHPYANCDASTTPPILNVNDFVCFQQQFAAGCP